MRTAVASVGLLWCALLGSGACTLLSYQDARLLAPRQLEVTPTFSQVEVSGIAVDENGNGQTVRLVNNIGAHVALGVHEGVNVSAGFEREQVLSGGGGGATGVGLGLAFSLKKDRLALFVPAALAFGTNVNTRDTLALRPTIVFTRALSSRIDLNPSGYVAFRFCKGCDVTVGAEAGFGIRTGSPHWILRPAIGVLVDPGHAGTYWSAGVGLSYRSKPR